MWSGDREDERWEPQLTAIASQASSSSHVCMPRHERLPLERATWTSPRRPCSQGPCSAQTYLLLSGTGALRALSRHGRLRPLSWSNNIPEHGLHCLLSPKPRTMSARPAHPGTHARWRTQGWVCGQGAEDRAPKLRAGEVVTTLTVEKVPEDLASSTDGGTKAQTGKRGKRPYRAMESSGA